MRWEDILNMLRGGGPIPPAPPPVRLGPSRRATLDPVAQAYFAGPRMRRGIPLAVKPHPEPLWAAMGWRREGRSYRGSFRVNGRSWAGLIDEPYAGRYDAYIYDPPLSEFRPNHPHRPCFRSPHSDGTRTRYEVHFHTMPLSVDHAITAIEDVLEEALQR